TVAPHRTSSTTPGRGVNPAIVSCTIVTTISVQTANANHLICCRCRWWALTYLETREAVDRITNRARNMYPTRRKGPELGVGQPGDADRVDGPLQTLPVVVGRETDLAGDDVARRQQTNGDSQPHEQTPPLRR